MLISLIGSHGTGKTTTSLRLEKKLGKSWSIFEDSYRKQAKTLGYPSPREILLEDQAIKHITSSGMTGAALGSLHEWCNHPERKNGIIDTGVPSLLAYHRYWMRVCETPVSPYLIKLCQQISNHIDLYIYLPVDTIPLVSDNVRNSDPAFQQDIDQWIQGIITELRIPSDKIYLLRQKSISGRVDEIISVIDSFQDAQLSGL